MRPHDEPQGHCSVDPISLLLGGIAGAFTGSSGSSAPAAAAPAAPPVPSTAAPPAQNPVGSASAKPAAPAQSFIGAAATPNTQSGQKTLLGQ